MKKLFILCAFLLSIQAYADDFVINVQTLEKLCENWVTIFGKKKVIQCLNLSSADVGKSVVNSNEVTRRSGQYIQINKQFSQLDSSSSEPLRFQMHQHPTQEIFARPDGCSTSSESAFFTVIKYDKDSDEPDTPIIYYIRFKQFENETDHKPYYKFMPEWTKPSAACTRLTSQRLYKDFIQWKADYTQHPEQHAWQISEEIRIFTENICDIETQIYAKDVVDAFNLR